jgi:phosphoribosylglycinamide formyltransferase-1
MAHTQARIAVLISGTGTNLQAILDACQSGELDAQVAAVISNKADAYGLVRAKKSGIPTVIFEKTKEQTRETYDTMLSKAVGEIQPDWVVLAGWMRILSMAFLGRFPGKVINLHPALPGTFPGTCAIERAYEAWENGTIDRSGVMVHLVPDDKVDAGPVLGVEEIPFRQGESLEEFRNRVHATEHKLLVDTLKLVIQKTEEKDETGDIFCL